MAEGDVPTLRDRPRLFVDYHDLELRENVRRSFHAAERIGAHPVLRQQEPWERHPGMTASVIFDSEERVFKAWYMAGFYAPGKEHVHCLALSDDGISWRRPELGLHEAGGSRSNNIVIPASYHDGKDHFESMLKDPLDPEPRGRYKALGWSSYDWDGPLSGIYSAVSPDGLAWTHTPEPLFRHHPRQGSEDLGPVGDAQSLMIDTERRRYAAFLRGQGARLMSWSEDFIHWTPPAPFLWPLHEEEALYNNTGFNYGEQYLGILTHFDKAPLEQTQTLSLLTSRDGASWSRVPAGPLVSLGDAGSWDRFQHLLTGAPPIAVGDRLYLYYRGTSRRHAKVAKEFERRIFADQDQTGMSIGLATLRLDGFASMDASYDGGWVLLRSMRLKGRELRLNVKADYGRATVELLDEAGAVVPGFSADECAPVQADGVDLPVHWRGGAALERLRGPVKLKIRLWNARLYSVKCV